MNVRNAFHASLLAVVVGGPGFLAAAPTTEWVWHKTADGLHPSGEEQQMVWLMNRARADPTAEGIWLADTGDPNVESTCSYYDVDRDMLRSEFATIDFEMPCAFDRRLYLAARQHADYMISEGGHTHDQQQAFIDASGFRNFLLGSYLSTYYDVFDGLYAHCGYNIDWGPGGAGGMLAGRGHRQTVMGTWPTPYMALSNCGIALVPKTNGRYCCSSNYTIADTNYAEHANYFILGTVYDDADGNGRYDPGEGLSNVRVQPDRGSWHAVTGVAGGYAIPASFVTYKLTFSGGELPFEAVTVKVPVSGQSVVRDIEVNRDLPASIGNVQATMAGPDWIQLSWDAEAGLRYDVEESDNLEDWSVRDPDIDGTEGQINRAYLVTGLEEHYFRVFAWRP